MSSRQSVVVSGAVEDLVDEAVLRRLVGEVRAAELEVVYGKTGKNNLRQRLPGFNRAAQFAPWVVLVDLDQDFECAPSLRASWLPNPARAMCFRVAVPEIEAWLLADREAIAGFLGLSVSQVPSAPDEKGDPKLTLVNLAQRSRRREIREDIAPRAGSGRSIGPAYTSRLIEFAEARWRPEVAEGRSESLRRCRRRLAQLVEERRRA